MSNNAAFEPAWDQANFQNLYRTTKNRLIQFNPGPLGAQQEWSVNHLDGLKTPEPKDWPVAQGDVMNAVFNQSCIEFDNHYRKTRLILDLRDLTKEPKRWKCEGPLIRYVLGRHVDRSPELPDDRSVPVTGEPRRSGGLGAAPSFQSEF